jgi:hypothetical protein
MAAHHADAGQPMPADLVASARTCHHRFPTATRQVSLRNTGVNTLWMSFDRVTWFDVACGTSWDDRVNVSGFWYRTQVGRTSLVVNALALNPIKDPAPVPAADEMT